MVAICCAFLVSSSASGAVIGFPKIRDWQGGTHGCPPGDPCTFSNLRVSEGQAQAPIGGTITRWRLNAQGAGTVRLQVLKRTVDEPGLAADEFKALRETADETTVVGTNVFDTSLRVRKGNFIGLTVVSGGALLRVQHGSRARFGIQQPAFISGGAASPFSSINPDQTDLLFNATVKR